MSLIQVQGLRPLGGELKIQGSKNAALPMMAAAVLHPGITRLSNVPDIEDVACMMDILRFLGCNCSRELDEVVIDASGICQTRIPEDYMKTMRSSVIVMGALIARTGKAQVGMPGGCSIGARPIDLHLYALQCLGAKVEEADGRIYVSADRLCGREIRFPFPSVGATEQALLAAAAAAGDTVIAGAAREPEIEALCGLLQKMGARIEGAGTDRLLVHGAAQEIAENNSTLSFFVPGDRIVAGTYLAAAMTAGGDIRLTGISPGHLAAVLAQMKELGASLIAGEDWIRVSMERRPSPGCIETAPYPGFPTDLQSPLMSVMAIADGESLIRETIFEKRYEAALQLAKLGARIDLDGQRAFIHGTYPLHGGEVEAPDLRGGASLVVAALAAEGATCISGCRHICRGYEDICRDLGILGADIRKMTGKPRIQT